MVWITATFEGLDGRVAAEGDWHILTVDTDELDVRRIWGMRFALQGAEECFQELCTLWVDVEDDRGVRGDASVNVLLEDGRDETH